LTERRAIVMHDVDIETIRRYLPGNYTATTYVVIEGEDVAGWTLDGYVIPRLGSGLICAREFVQKGQ
jgi:hypothetical protein